jgi:hypothetical protein
MFLLERLLGFYLFGLMRFFELTPEWLETLRRRRETAADDYRARWEARRKGHRPNDVDISKHDRYVEISFKSRR